MSDKIVCCCVSKCPNTTKTNTKKLFDFPGNRFRSVQRNRWISAIKKKNGSWWNVRSDSMVCSDHFIRGRPSMDPKHEDYVPTVFPDPLLATVEKSVRYRSVSVKEFALEYIKYDALLEKPTRANSDNEHRKCAYILLAQALNISVNMARTWEQRFREYFENKMLIMARRGKSKLTRDGHAPPWVRAVEARLKVLQNIHIKKCRREQKITRDMTPGGVVNALCAASSARGSLCSTTMYSDVKRALRLATGLNDLHAVWVSAQRVSLEQVICAGRAGDRTAAAAPSDAARVADLVLLHTDVDMHRLLTHESVSLYEESAALHKLWQLVQCHQLEETTPHPHVRALRWSRAYREYRDSGREASIIVLQRRWHELKLQARERLAAHWKRQATPTATNTTTTCATSATSATTATPVEVPPETVVPRPAPIHLNILKKYPYIAMCTLPSWRQLVLAGLVVTKPLVKVEDDEQQTPEYDPPDKAATPGDRTDAIYSQSPETDTENNLIIDEFRGEHTTNTSNTQTIDVLQAIDPTQIKKEIVFESDSDNNEPNERTGKVEIDMNLKQEVGVTESGGEVAGGGNVVDGTVWQGDQEMCGLGDGDNGYEPNIDSKLLLDSCVSLVKVDETPAWKKHARRNKTINISRVNTDALAPRPKHSNINRDKDNNMIADVIKRACENIKRKCQDNEQYSIPTKVAKINDIGDTDEDEPLLVVKNKSKEVVITRKPVEYNIDSSDDEALIKVREKKKEATAAKGKNKSVEKNNRKAKNETNKTIESDSEETEDASEFSDQSDEEFFLTEADRKKKQKKKARDYKEENRNLKLSKSSSHSAASTIQWNVRFDPLFGDTARIAKRVELPNIEEVRRVNSNILTAQVAPITAMAMESQPATRFIYADQAQYAPEEGMPTEEQLETLLDELAVTSTRSAQQVLDVPHCCAARRHRLVNDARRQIGLTDIPIHTHSVSSCSCCCAQLCETSARVWLNVQLKQLHEDIANMLRGADDASRSKEKSYYKREKDRRTYKPSPSSSSAKATSLTASPTPISATSSATPTSATSSAKSSLSAKPISVAESSPSVKPISSPKPSSLTRPTASTPTTKNCQSSMKTAAGTKLVPAKSFTSAKSISSNKPISDKPKDRKVSTSGKPTAPTSTETFAKPSLTKLYTLLSTSSTKSSASDATSVDYGYDEWLRQKNVNAQYFHINPYNIEKNNPSNKVMPTLQPSQNKTLMTLLLPTPNNTQDIVALENDFFTPLNDNDQITSVPNLTTPTTGVAPAPVLPIQLNANNVMPITNFMPTAAPTQYLIAPHNDANESPFSVNNDDNALLADDISSQSVEPPIRVLAYNRQKTTDTKMRAVAPSPTIVVSPLTPSVPNQTTDAVTNLAPIAPEVTPTKSVLKTNQINAQKTTENTTESTPPNVSTQNYPKISVVPFETLADVSKKPTDQCVLIRQVKSVAGSENSQNITYVPLQLKIPGVHKNEESQIVPTTTNVSVLEQISQALMPGMEIANPALNAMSLQVPGPQGPQTTIIMAVTLPTQKVKYTVDSDAPLDTVDLTSDTEGNDDEAQQSAVSDIQIAEIRSEASNDDSIVENRTLMIPTQADTESNEDHVNEGAHAPTVTILNGTLSDHCDTPGSTPSSEIYTYKEYAGTVTPAQLACGSTLICIDGIRAPFRVMDAASNPINSYLVLTTTKIFVQIPTYWTRAPYSAVARVITPPGFHEFMLTEANENAEAEDSSATENDVILVEKTDSGITCRIALNKQKSNSAGVHKAVSEKMGRGVAMPVNVRSCKCSKGNHYSKILTVISTVKRFRALVAIEAPLVLMNVRTARTYPLTVTMSRSHGYALHGSAPQFILKKLQCMLNRPCQQNAQHEKRFSRLP